MEKKDLGIYIHIPFCVKKCGYCDFPSYVCSNEEMAYYFRVLRKEIRSFEAISTLYTVRSVYIGGGTPTSVEPRHLEQILEQLREEFLIAADAEISMESNPGTLTAEKLAAYRSMGINRLSMGLQSADDRELRLLERIHTYDVFEENYRLARECGFRNINVDLMSALPGQDMQTWADTLRKVTALEPEHISAYSLIIEEGTPFYDRYEAGPDGWMLPDEDTERGMYYYTGEELARNGYDRYEISNYAKPGFACRHNMVYWTMKDYVGFGLGAASYLDGKRFSNPKGFEAYYEYAKVAYPRFRYMEPMSEKAAMEEYVFLGLRMMKGIDADDFDRRFSFRFMDLYGEIVNGLCSQGFMQRDGRRFRLTDRGIDVSNRVLAMFLL